MLPQLPLPRWNSAGRKSSFRPHRKGGLSHLPRSCTPSRTTPLRSRRKSHHIEVKSIKRRLRRSSRSRSRSRRRRSHHHRRREESEETGGRRSPRNYLDRKGKKTRPGKPPEPEGALQPKKKAPIREQWLPREELDHEGLQLRRMACAALQ